MKHLFVPYEIALQLKEKGFDEPCICMYNYNKYLRNILASTSSSDCNDYISYDKKYDNRLLAPLYQQVIDWFREKHEIYISAFIQFEPEIEDEQEEAIIHIYEILNLKKMRKAEQSYLPYIETHSFFENSTINEHYASLNEAIEEALKLI